MVTLATPIRTYSLLLVGADDRRRDGSPGETLASAGYTIHTVESGEAALREYEACEPDLVFIDKWLPGIGPLETCRRLQERHGERCAPVLLARGDSDLFDDAETLPEGVIDYVSETTTPTELVARVRAHLENRRREAHQRALADARAEALETQRKLLRMCAHDLRTPLSSICGLAEFLLEPGLGALNERQAQVADAIRDAGRNVLNLVNQLFDVSLADAGHLKLERSPASLREIAQRAIFLAEVPAGKKCIRLLLQPPVEAEPELMIDATRIREVVDNLLSNAVKYSPPGSLIGVSIEYLPAGLESGPSVRFSVRDQGPGVRMEERDLLFREFGRLSARPTAGEKSTGLGLAICRKIIDLHGGSIGAVNHPAGGCVFSFILPLFPCN